MPIIKSAIKRAKQATVRRERNIVTKKEVKSAVKEFHASPSAKTLAAAHSEIDTAVKKNVLNKHTAARRKSQLSKVAKNAGVKLGTVKKEATKTADKKPVATKSTPVKKPAATKPAAAKSTKKTAAPVKKTTTAPKAAVKKTAAKTTTKSTSAKKS